MSLGRPWSPGNGIDLRRAISILLLLLLGTPMLLPLPAASGDSDAGLPACCRREGVHHCAMTLAERGALPGKTISAPRRGCPSMPVPTPPPAFHMEASVRAADARLPLPASTHRKGPAQTEVRRRIAAERARQKRGPPTSGSQALFPQQGQPAVRA